MKEPDGVIFICILLGLPMIYHLYLTFKWEKYLKDEED
jgi:hypothetical protein